MNKFQHEVPQVSVLPWIWDEVNFGVKKSNNCYQCFFTS